LLNFFKFCAPVATISFFVGAIHEKHNFKYLKNPTVKVCKIWYSDVYLYILYCDIFWWKLIDRIFLIKFLIPGIFKIFKIMFFMDGTHKKWNCRGKLLHAHPLLFLYLWDKKKIVTNNKKLLNSYICHSGCWKAMFGDFFFCNIWSSLPPTNTLKQTLPKITKE
jgi:hypothetical protein